MSLVFSVLRAVNIVSPFTNISKKGVVASIVVYTCFWGAVLAAEIVLVFTIVDLSDTDEAVETFVRGYFYKPGTPSLVFYLTTEFDVTDHGTKCALGLLYTALPITLCGVLAAGAALVQVYHLLARRRDEVLRDDDSKKRIRWVVLLRKVIIT